METVKAERRGNTKINPTNKKSTKMNIDFFNMNRERLISQLTQQNSLSLQFLRTAKELQELELKRQNFIKNERV